MSFWKRDERKETVKAYKRLFDSDDGKVVLRDLMKSCHILTSTMDSSTNEILFKEGSRSVVLRIIRTIGISEIEMERMLDEN